MLYMSVTRAPDRRDCSAAAATAARAASDRIGGHHDVAALPARASEQHRRMRVAHHLLGDVAEEDRGEPAARVAADDGEPHVERLALTHDLGVRRPRADHDLELVRIAARHRAGLVAHRVGEARLEDRLLAHLALDLLREEHVAADAARRHVTHEELGVAQAGPLRRLAERLVRGLAQIGGGQDWSAGHDN